ncbi:hypothetical protein [Lysinibacillus pakistanensis]|uniref:hypothetical protein n=1 Tax=Lysinibacillus pakistanensis TaxID=759811 RepID=UPI003D2866BB
MAMNVLALGEIRYHQVKNLKAPSRYHLMSRKKRKIECLADHQFHIDGWGDLPEKGHNFVRSIIVITKDF